MIPASEQINSIQRALDELAPFLQAPQQESESTVMALEAITCLEAALGLLTDSKATAQPKPNNKGRGYRFGYPFDWLDEAENE